VEKKITFGPVYHQDNQIYLSLAGLLEIHQGPALAIASLFDAKLSSIAFLN